MTSESVFGPDPVFPEGQWPCVESPFEPTNQPLARRVIEREDSRLLDHGELNNLADRDVWIDEEYANPPPGMQAIVDAECELVCYATPDKAPLLVRLINTYRTR